MAAVARISQLVCTKTSHTIRTEAVRTERDRLPHQPLQAYMDADNIERHTIPWQQILMFFTRTQATHEWASPNYKFTRRQRAAWNSLWKLAQQGVSPSVAIARSASVATASDNSEDSESEDSESGPRETTQRIASESSFKLAPIDSACLNFCIELLNHRIKVEDYKSALICATAVLGRGEAGWRTAESYPPILRGCLQSARLQARVFP